MPQLDSSENVFAFISYWKLKIDEEKRKLLDVSPSNEYGP